MREDIADPARDGLVDFLRVEAAHVVGFEDCVERHAVAPTDHCRVTAASEPVYGSAGSGSRSGGSISGGAPDTSSSMSPSEASGPPFSVGPLPPGTPPLL